MKKPQANTPTAVEMEDTCEHQLLLLYCLHVAYVLCVFLF